jgi:acetyltransferase-like isoleucine patch superfamily enzyme
LIYGGMPMILGKLHIEVAENSRISAATTFSGRSASKNTPLLSIGENVDIGWQTGIAVGSKIIIGDNVRIAGRSTLAGYPGHPLNAERRAAGEPEDDDQVGDIILEDDVWLATGVNVMANVRIGKGTVVACGSVVTKDLPPNVLAGGIPAKVIRQLTENDNA